MHHIIKVGPRGVPGTELFCPSTPGASVVTAPSGAQNTYVSPALDFDHSQPQESKSTNGCMRRGDDIQGIHRQHQGEDGQGPRIFPSTSERERSCNARRATYVAEVGLR